MTLEKVARRVVELGLMLFGLAAAIAAYVDGAKPWICLTIAVGALGLHEILYRLNHD